MASKRVYHGKNNRLTVMLILIIAGLSAAIFWNVRTFFTPANAGRKQIAQEMQTDEQNPPDSLEDTAIPEDSGEKADSAEESQEGASHEIASDLKEESLKMPELQAEASEPAVEPSGRQIMESAPVDDVYFKDAVFIGNSRTEGFKLFSGLNQGTYLYGTGATVDTVFNKSTWSVNGKAMPILDAVKTMHPAKIYVMLGVNELGWPKTDVFKKHYGKLVDRLKEDHPDAEIILQSILPVTKKQVEKGSYVNNDKIQKFNAAIAELAEENQCWYLNVQTAVADEQGFLREELSHDGIHLNRDGCRLWHDYLCTHTIA